MFSNKTIETDSIELQPLTEVADSNLGTRQKVKKANDLVGGIQYTFAFTAMSHDNWLNLLTQGIGQFLFFPSFAAMAIFKAGLYLYDLIKSKNKNLGKVASFIREVIAATIITTAIVFSFFTATILATITPMLFVGALGLNAVYNMGAAAYTGYKWATTQDQEQRQLYKANCIKHTIGAAIASTVTVGVGLMMIAKIAPMAMSIMNAVVNGAGFLLGAVTAIKQYRDNKKQEAKLQLEANLAPDSENDDMSDEDDLTLDQKPEVSPQFSTSAIIKQISTPRPTLSGYFIAQKRDVKILEYKKQNNRKTYLLNEINKKLSELEKNHPSYKSTTITNKIIALNALKDKISDDGNTREHFETLLKKPIFTSQTANPFQSFFRQRSDVQDIFMAAEQYYNHKPQATVSI